MLHAGPAWAQAPASELFFGYSYLRASPGEAQTEGEPLVDLDSQNLHGGEVTFTHFFDPLLGIDGNLGYHNGSVTFAPELLTPPADFTQTTLMAGPRLRLATDERFTASIRGLLGVSIGDVRTVTGLLPTSFAADETAFAAAVGASLTFNTSNVLAIRVHPEVLLTTFGDETQTNFKVTTGLVIRY